MVPFKPYFLGKASPPARRLTSVQKCFRTTDIGSVGDTSHLTFFEMLGNFSLGDYFKEEAIAWAWEFVTQVLRLPPQRLWVTIYEDDEEAFRAWRALKVPAERIARGDEKSNYWFSGETGPCGPCSEIHYDLGQELACGPDCSPTHDCGRFLEVWNLVFMTYFRHADGSRTPLPTRNIDTGAGLERLAVAVQGCPSVYETDLFAPIIARVEELCGRRYRNADEATRRALRVVAEHARALTFLIADGVVPSNEGRGYVLRRVLRRAVYFGQKLGLDGPFLAPVAEAVIEVMGEAYPELRAQGEFILRVMEAEEERFQNTLLAGRSLLEEMLAAHAQEGVLPGREVFILYDTYGFPKELTAELARERGIAIDEEGFQREMAAQRERARAAQAFGRHEAPPELYTSLAPVPTAFLGYETLTCQSTILGLVVGGEPVEQVEEGQRAEVILRETPFYAEAGGQVGDRGEIVGPAGRLSVEDVQKVGAEVIVHRGQVVQGSLAVNDPVTAQVDEGRRLDTMRNHTATHLLHAALRRILGHHVRQAGSLVAPDRLRFDFTHIEALKPQELRQVQALVNEKIRQDLPVRTRHTSYNQALQEGVLAFFDEAYGDVVRVVEVLEEGGPFSAELCGGTHCRSTGQIGFFYIVDEGSVGAGVRRIEALTGRGAEEYVERQRSSLLAASRRLATTPGELEARIAALQGELEESRRRLESLERELQRRELDRYLARVQRVGDVAVVATTTSASSVKALRELGDLLKARLGSAVIVLATLAEGGPQFVAMVTPDLVQRGLHAGQILRQVAAITGGGAGGRPEMAQGGGKDPHRLEEALASVLPLVERELTQG